MKFIISIEENGYEIRCWDEMNEDMGEQLISSWKMKDIYNKFKEMHFSIDPSLKKHIDELLDDKGFIVLAEDETDGSLFHSKLELF